MDIEQIVEAVIAQLNGHHKQQSKVEEYRLPSSSVEHAHDQKVIDRARSLTPARLGIGHTGTRMKTPHYLQFRIDHAAAQDAVTKEVDEQFLQQHNLPQLESSASDLKQYLMDLSSGRKLSEHSATWIRENWKKGVDVAIIVSNGLSSAAVTANIGDMLPALKQGLQLKNITFNEPIYVKRARVWLQDEVAKIVQCKLAVILIGERPGLNTAQSLSAYLIYSPNENTVEADRTVISNIHAKGLAPTEAGAYLSELMDKMLKLQCTGVQFTQKNS